MKYLLLIATPLLLTACMGDGPVRPGRPLPPGAQCDAGPAQRFVGAPFRPQLAQQAKRMSRARTVRAIRPSQAVTMDFRGDRLNVEIDERNRVRAVRCG
jgi:Peptidase inhibitor I78 family